MTVYKLIKAGLPAFRLGADRRFQRADLEKWIAQQYVLLEEPKANKAERPGPQAQILTPMGSFRFYRRSPGPSLSVGTSVGLRHGQPRQSDPDGLNLWRISLRHRSGPPRGVRFFLPFGRIGR